MGRKKIEVRKGDRYGRLTIIKEAEEHIQPNGTKVRRLLCLCDCGNESIVMLTDLMTGHTKSCGCLQREKTIHKMTTHKKTGSREYRTWDGMKDRCSNPNNPRFSDYGGRGITVCDRWKKFENFYKDMGERPINKTLDRIDNDKGYFKENCRWSTISEQNNNTRRNVFLIYRGKRKTIAQWPRRTGIKYVTLKRRINNYDWSVEKALTTPVKKMSTTNKNIYCENCKKDITDEIIYYNNNGYFCLDCWVKEDYIIKEVKKVTLKDRIKKVINYIFDRR